LDGYKPYHLQDAVSCGKGHVLSFRIGWKVYMTSRHKYIYIYIIHIYMYNNNNRTMYLCMNMLIHTYIIRFTRNLC
jgi:hypothetical protein